MDNNSKEKNKSLRRAMTAEKLTEMLREIDISAAVESEGTYTAMARLTALFDHGTFSRIGVSFISSITAKKSAPTRSILFT